MHVCVKIMSKGSKETLTVLIVTHVTQVERVKSGVCCFYTTLHTEYCIVTQFFTHVNWVESVKYYVLYSVYRAPHSSRREGYLKSLPSCGLVVHHQSARGGSFVNFLGLVNYKGDCRQDAQPIPNS